MSNVPSRARISQATTYDALADEHAPLSVRGAFYVAITRGLVGESDARLRRRAARPPARATTGAGRTGGGRVTTAEEFLDWLDNLPESAWGGLNALMPLYERNQVDPAERDLRRILNAVNAITGGTIRQSGGPRFVRLFVVETVTAWLDGRASTCLHSIRPTPGVQAFMAVRKPGLVVCSHCTRLLRPPPDQEHVCDSCGREDPTVRTNALNLGRAVIEYGLCGRCAL